MTPEDQDPPSPPVEPEWRTLVNSKWEALRREALGLAPLPRRKLSQLGRECQALAAVVVWFEAGGNITQAASRMGVSRRVIRTRIAGWRKDNPQLVPRALDCELQVGARRRLENEPSTLTPVVRKRRPTSSARGGVAEGSPTSRPPEP